MIDELKQLIGMIEKVPETALWILLGFAVYKLVVYLSGTGAIVFCIKLAIEKGHDMFIRRQAEKSTPIEHTINGEFITQDATLTLFMSAIRALKGGDTYIHTFHVNWLQDAIAEKASRDGIPTCHYKPNGGKQYE